MRTNNKALIPVEIRFWGKVQKSESCWNWTGAVRSSGYGVMQSGRRGEGLIVAHRFSFELHNGPIPSGLFALHKCNNKLCVNPRHLYVGDHSANLRDAWRDGLRKPFKISLAAVKQIRAKFSAGAITQTLLAKQFRVSISMVNAIVRNKSRVSR